MDLNKLDPIRVIITAAMLTSVGAVTELLFSNRQLRIRTFVATSLFGSIVGAGIALCWYNYFFSKGNVAFLLGVSAFAGLGGMRFLKTLTDVAGTALLAMWNGLRSVGSKDES